MAVGHPHGLHQRSSVQIGAILYEEDRTGAQRMCGADHTCTDPGGQATGIWEECQMMGLG